MVDAIDPAVYELAKQLQTLRREMRTMARAAQGPRRSVDVTTGGTTYYSESGTPLLQVGVQPDGNFGVVNVDPTVPPVPTEPFVTPVIAGVKIAWDGTFVNSNWTSNVSHVEVHVSDVSGFIPVDATQVATFNSTYGGEFTYSTPNDSEPKYIVLVTVSHAGVESGPSLEGVGAALIVNAEVAAAIDELVAQVNDNIENIINNQNDLDNLALIQQALADQSASWDGRVSTSDFDPGTEDVAGRTDGSIWLTRTRPRKNWCTNPSFETNLTSWAAAGAAITRVADTPAVDGGFVMRIANTAVAENHHVTWDNGGVRLPVGPGTSVAASIYSRLESGVGAGAFAQIVWYDVANAVISTTDGATATIPATWVDPPLLVTGVAPANTVSCIIRVWNPNDSAVWRVDGCLIEFAGFRGSYFDGSSFDSAWDGTADAATSTMVGGKIVKLFELDEGAWRQRFWTGAVLKDLDASTITTGTMDGEFVTDRTIAIDKMEGIPVQASEALAAGDLVNIYNLSGQFRVRKANAGSNREAHGYVLEAVTLNGVSYIYSFGYNPLLSGLTPGPQFLSTVSGKCSSTPPTVIGTVVQQVGVAAASGLLDVVIGDPIFLV